MAKRNGRGTAPRTMDGGGTRDVGDDGTRDVGDEGTRVVDGGTRTTDGGVTRAVGDGGARTTGDGGTRAGDDTASRTLYDGGIWVHNGQFSVESRRGTLPYGLAESFAGQRGGLCGGATPGFLCLNTGLPTGRVGVTVELHRAPPPVDDTWEEIVEVSFTPASPDVGLLERACEGYWPLALDQVSHRVRYCGTGMRQTAAEPRTPSGTPRRDRYLLQFWPAPPAEDRIVKCTSDTAERWHAYARGLSTSTPLDTP